MHAGNGADSAKILMRQVAAYFHKEAAADSIIKKWDAEMAGAALGAAVIFVFGKETIFSFTETLGPPALPLMAFIGAFAATIAVYKIASTFGKINIFILLLAGIAVNAVCNAGTGFLSYMARDPQARSITF